MKPRHIVLKELMNRKSEFLASFLAVLLGIAIIVSVRTISVSSREKIKNEMHSLGSNMLVLPSQTKVSSYYTADFGEEVMPERYIHILNTAEFSEKVHEMIPKLSSRIAVEGHKAILTGVLPKEEFKAKPEWKVAGFLKQPPKKAPEPKVEKSTEDERPGVKIPTLRYGEPKAKRKAIDSLGPREAILGSEIASSLGIKEGTALEIEGREFTVSQIWEETGTVDDIRIFAHLHTVQDILGKGPVINAIEIVGCGCTMDLIKLGKDIEKILPGTKVITIRHIAQTQSNTIKMMEGFSLILLIIIVVIGGASIANYASANVYERRREIGTLLAVGATPGAILSIFLQKAVLLGLFGGITGYFMGTGLAVVLGPKLVKAQVIPQPLFLIWSTVIALSLNIVFSLIPARKAANLDPAQILQEV